MGLDSILLTGASGFIGSRVLPLLIERGYNLRTLTRRQNLLEPSVESLTGDIADAFDCRRALRGVNVVIHVAGEKANPGLLWRVNVQGTRNLLVAALDEGVDRFVHVSSVGVIGADPLEKRAFDEAAPCRPRNAYEESKYEAERLVLQAHRRGMACTILRPANVFGDCDPRNGLLGLMKNIKLGRFAYLGGRESLCNYVFVEDVANAILALVENSVAVRHIYHLSDSCMIGDFVDALADNLGVKRPSMESPKWLVRLVRAILRNARGSALLSNSSSFARLISLSNQASFASHRIADELGFEFAVGWRAGVRRIVEWYMSRGAV